MSRNALGLKGHWSSGANGDTGRENLIVSRRCTD